MQPSLKQTPTTQNDSHSECGECSAIGPAAQSANQSESESASSVDPTLPFFTNRNCPYFPCHEGVDPNLFNCLFCFCPLYALGPRCGGQLTYTDAGVKDCSRCTLPHEGNNGNALVNAHFAELAKLAERV